MLPPADFSRCRKPRLCVRVADPVPERPCFTLIMAASPKDPSAFLNMLDARTSPVPDEAGAGTKPAAKRKRKKSRAAPRLSTVLPHSETVETDDGTCVRVAARAPVSGERSNEGYICPVQTFAHPEAPEALALLGRSRAWRDVAPERIAFVDVETTSLQGGSGTVAFLIGVGRFEGETFCVRQYFMEDFDQEPAMIRAVADELAEADAVVSYNGKTFDLPIMEVRWRLAKLKPKFPELHLDLLHPSRRLWSGRLPDCRLGTVERRILSILRYSDAPSAEIPQLYFDYVRGVKPQRMGLVFDHHAQDIFSLAALTQALARAVADPEDERFLHASDQAGLARLFQSGGDAEAAAAALRRAIEAADDEDTAFRLSMLLGRGLKRQRRHAEAVELWQRWADKAALHRLDPLIELAKHAEHRLKDHAAAERWTRRALDIVEQHRELADWIGKTTGAETPLADRLEALNRRLRRVELKKQRSSTKR